MAAPWVEVCIDCPAGHRDGQCAVPAISTTLRWGLFQLPESLAALRSLLGETGTALIGAAAIAFSLIVFAMQTNVERMPHGLFRQLSSDRWLLCLVLGSIPDGDSCREHVPSSRWELGVPAIVIALWGIAVTLLLFLVAYRRALKLINPIEQLAIMSRVARRDLQRWGRLADRAAIVLQENPLPAAAEADIDIPFDRPKAHFFQVNASERARTAGDSLCRLLCKAICRARRL